MIYFFWLKETVILIYRSGSDVDYMFARLRAHDMHSIVLSVLFKKNCAVDQALLIGMWRSVVLCHLL